MSATLQLPAGEVFARDFRVLRPLAEGGMGAVYVVEQLSTGRERALKIMHPQFARREDTRERFTQEARVGARIKSEHVVEVLSAGVDEASGIPWLAMELLEGAELGAVVEGRGRLTPGEVLELFRQLCHGLGEAHRAGLVHRDLKPQNLFVHTSHRQGAGVTLKILDFGVAKLLQEGALDDASTRSVGTPKWMAPEQSESGGHVCAATDVWPLGLIAFYLLTGRVYWKAAASPHSSLSQLMREMVLEPVEPASVRAAAFGLSEPLMAGFDAWFARCLERESSARFHDAYAALEALTPILEGVSGPTGPGTLAGVADYLRANTVRNATGPMTPGPARATDSGDGATVYPAKAGPTPAPRVNTLPPPPGPSPFASPNLAPVPAPALAPAPEASRARPAIVAGAVGGLVIVLGLVAIEANRQPPAPVPAPPAPAQLAPQPATPPAEKPLPKPAGFELTIESRPPGAVVLEGDLALGTTPIRVAVPLDSFKAGPRRFTLRLGGFLPQTLEQGPAEGPVHLVVALLPEPQPPPIAAEAKRPPRKQPKGAEAKPKPSTEEPQQSVIRLNR